MGIYVLTTDGNISSTETHKVLGRPIWLALNSRSIVGVLFVSGLRDGFFPHEKFEPSGRKDTKGMFLQGNRKPIGINQACDNQENLDSRHQRFGCPRFPRISWRSLEGLGCFSFLTEFRLQKPDIFFAAQPSHAEYVLRNYCTLSETTKTAPGGPC